MEQYSYNGKLVLEAYSHGEVKSEMNKGWVSVGQKNNLKGLKVLVGAKFSVGGETVHVPTGTIAYIKEELLHTQQWAKNKLKSDTLPGEFILANINDVEYFSNKPEDAA